MKNRNSVLLCSVFFAFCSCVVFVKKNPYESFSSGETRKIHYAEFPGIVTEILKSPEINLEIVKVTNDTIEAVEYYKGRSRLNLVFDNKLIEKTMYTLTFREIAKPVEAKSKGKVSFFIKTKTSEAKNKQSDDWRIVSPTKITKVNKILSAILNIDK